MALALAGCTSLASPSPDPTRYIPNVVGLVRQVDVVGEDVRYILADGRQFTFPQSGVFLRGARPRPDAILLAGSVPAPWVAWAELRAASSLTPSGCYVLYGEATATPTHILQTIEDPRGNVVIALPKSPDWTDQGTDPGSNHLAGVYTCLNLQGQAFHRGI